MFENLEIFRMAHGMAQHAGTRQTVIARNVANADTPGYAAQDIPGFMQTYRAAPSAMPMRTTRAGHVSPDDGLSRGVEIITTDAGSSPNGNSVSLEQELMKAAEIKSDHNRALAIYRSSLNILRTTLGGK